MAQFGWRRDQKRSHESLNGQAGVRAGSPRSFAPIRISLFGGLGERLDRRLVAPAAVDRRRRVCAVVHHSSLPRYSFLYRSPVRDSPIITRRLVFRCADKIGPYVRLE